MKTRLLFLFILTYGFWIFGATKKKISKSYVKSVLVKNCMDSGDIELNALALSSLCVINPIYCTNYLDLTLEPKQHIQINTETKLGINFSSPYPYLDTPIPLFFKLLSSIVPIYKYYHEVPLGSEVIFSTGYYEGTSYTIIWVDGKCYGKPCGSKLSADHPRPDWNCKYHF